jgi:hypothetical protein
LLQERERLAQLAIEKQVKEFKVAPAGEDLLLRTAPISPDANEIAKRFVTLELGSQKPVEAARKESKDRPSKKEYYGEGISHKVRKRALRIPFSFPWLPYLVSHFVSG